MSDDYRALMQDALRELRRHKARIAELEAGASAAGGPLAVVGLGCRLPGAIEDPDALWSFLLGGGEAIGPAPRDRWPAADAPFPVPPGAFLHDPFGFDAALFRVPPREARLLDPQHRLLLEVAHATFEQAGLAPRALRGSDTGVFVGLSTEDWAMQLARHLPLEALDGCIGPGANGCGASGRVSFTFGLQGPSLTVNTACSSSLVALHLARQALRRGECELALVLGVNLMLSPLTFATFQKAGMLSPDGRCHTFAAGANGYGRGEGAVGVLLATPAAAARLGLTSQAELLGSAVNQDGATAGLTVPSGPAQQRVLRAALRDAGLQASDVQYVEAHGTGTLLGDPIEVQALAAVHGDGRAATEPLWIASAKTNFGHLEAAAGLLGVLKVVLQLQHREVVPHLHAAQRNPYLPWARLPLRVPEVPMPWPGEGRAIAGVSSFGFTGTNAHVLLGEAPPLARPAAVPAAADPATAGPWLLPLCARTPAALRVVSRRWADALAARPTLALADVVATACLGRNLDRVRLAALADTHTALVQRLLAAANGVPAEGLWVGEAAAGEPPAEDVARADLVARARAFVQGATLPFERWLPASARRLSLPTYAFQRRAYRLPTAGPVAPPAGDAASLRASLATATPAGREALLTSYVQQVVAAVLELSTDDIEADEPLADFGFDSLRAVDLANRLEAGLGQPTPLLALHGTASARDLARAIAASWPAAGPAG